MQTASLTATLQRLYDAIGEPVDATVAREAIAEVRKQLAILQAVVDRIETLLTN